MANSNTIGLGGELGNSIATIVAAEALGYLQANTVLAQLVARDWDNDVATHGQTVDVPFRGTVAANPKATDSEVTLNVPEDSKASVSLDQHEEVSFVIEDIGEALSRPQYLEGYVTDAMAVLAEELDDYIAALYSGFSQSIDATAGLAEDDFREARRQLNAAKAPLNDRFAVLHEDAEYELLGIEKFVNQDYRGLQGAPEGLIRAFTGRFVGFDVFTDQKINIDTTQAKNLLFQRNAIMLASRPLPTAPAGWGAVQRVMDEGGIGLRVTLSYDTGYMGAKATVDVLYGAAELRDNHAVVVSTSEI
jgi:hypothetical protein